MRTKEAGGSGVECTSPLFLSPVCFFCFFLSFVRRLWRKGDRGAYYSRLLIYCMYWRLLSRGYMTSQPNKNPPKKRIHSRPHISPSGTGPTARAQYNMSPPPEGRGRMLPVYTKQKKERKIEPRAGNPEGKATLAKDVWYWWPRPRQIFFAG